MQQDVLAPVESVDDPLQGAVRHSHAAWRGLGLHIQTVTPSQVARAALIGGAVAAIAWVTSMAWSQLLPFQLGLVLAYITLPLVNWLDRLMPRPIAASVVVLLEVGAIVALGALLVPPLLQEITTLIAALPDPTLVQARLVDLRSALQSLPPPVQDLVKNGADQVVTNVRINAVTYFQAILQVALGTALSLIGTLGFVIGFLGIPTWLVGVMSDHRAGIRAINRVMPATMQPDFWAVMRILDRTFSAFVRGQLLFGVATACVLYAGYWLLDRLHLSVGEFRLVLAAFAGLMQLIPAVGPILGAIPAVAIAATESPTAAIAVLAMYIAAQLLLSSLIAPLVANRYVDIHPAVFVIVLVLLSQFGFVWLLVAAPLSVALRDLFRYAYGRLSDPPRPAGVAPGEAVRVAAPIRRLR